MAGEPVARGLGAIRALSSGGHWSPEDLDAIADVIDAIDETPYGRRSRERIAALLAAIEAWPAPRETPPEAVVDAARRCLGPLPMRGRGTPRPPMLPERFRAVRAMAVGGAATERYGGFDAYELVQQALQTFISQQGLRIAFAISGEGHLLGASGDVGSIDTMVLARRADERARELATELRSGPAVLVGDAGTHIVMERAGDRAILVAMHDGPIGLSTFSRFAGELGELLETLVAELALELRRITDAELDELFEG